MFRAAVAADVRRSLIAASCDGLTWVDWARLLAARTEHSVGISTRSQIKCVRSDGRYGRPLLPYACQACRGTQPNLPRGTGLARDGGQEVVQRNC